MRVKRKDTIILHKPTNENIYKIQTYLNLNPRFNQTKDPRHDYITPKLQRYNRLITQQKTSANLVKTC